jgi:hypothetical protein
MTVGIDIRTRWTPYPSWDTLFEMFSQTGGAISNEFGEKRVVSFRKEGKKRGTKGTSLSDIQQRFGRVLPCGPGR